MTTTMRCATCGSTFPTPSDFAAHPCAPKPRIKAKLPTNSAERKNIPIFTGCIDYFPLAIAEVARLSKVGNDKHNPGQPLHWSRHLSNDHADTLGRHMLERGTVDTDGVRHIVKVAWRALAMAQLELEEAAKASED